MGWVTTMNDLHFTKTKLRLGYVQKEKLTAIEFNSFQQKPMNTLCYGSMEGQRCFS